MGLTKTTIERIKAINYLLNRYGPMTIRQIFYQLVPSGLKYEHVQYAVQRGREEGLIELDTIVDRSRPSYGLYKFSSLSEYLYYSQQNFQLDYWENQNFKLECWSEKDALSQIIGQVAIQYRVPVRVTKGFLSTSNKYKWGSRDTIILYFGDHDPSGLSIDFDLQNNQFLEYLDFKRIALSMEQIRKHSLPHVKVKKKDPRAREYIQKFGMKCWELDALPPDELRELVRASIEQYVSFDLEQKRVREQDIKDTLVDLAKDLHQNEEFANDQHGR